ncbi:MAG: SDR family oxidoreductase [Arenicellales bacterium]
MNTQTFNNKTFLITGAGFDIGKALALRCAAQGAHIILMDKDNRALNAVYDEIKADYSTESTILKLEAKDFSGETAELIRQQIIDEHGQLDALIHTANAAFALTPINLVEDDVLDKALHILCTLPHRISRELHTVLALAKQPSIIFTSHFSAHTHKPFWGYHAGAFAALEATARQWAADSQKQGFSVNSIDPGAVNTSVRRKHYPAEEQVHLRTPDDSEIMSLYLNLLSDTGKARSGEHFVLPDLNA